VTEPPESDFEQSIPSSADVENEWSHTSILVFCLYGVDRGNLTLLFLSSVQLRRALTPFKFT
jgi:hypothetical protein